MEKEPDEKVVPARDGAKVPTKDLEGKAPLWTVGKVLGKVAMVGCWKEERRVAPRKEAAKEKATSENVGNVVR